MAMLPVSIDIVTEGGDREFEIRFDREEGVGLLTAKTGDSYLVLDSIEYWFDVVQDSYLKKKTCVCKNQWFLVQFDFIPREGTDDFRSIVIRGVCSTCRRERKIDTVDLDYSPTQDLLDSPITFCPNPRLKCSIRQVNGYWDAGDRLGFLLFMTGDLGLETYCWYWDRETGERLLDKIDESNRPRLLSTDVNYLDYYFSYGQILLETMRVDGGIYVQGDPWRKNELVQLAAPMNMMLKNGLGELYCLYFSSQYIDAGVVRDKSRPFVELCDSILEWFKGAFVAKRGKDCFDSRVEYDRLELSQFSRR